MNPKIIAEIKKGTPTSGILQPNVDPVFYATEYQRLGAKAVSVVTAPAYFGKKEWLPTVKANTTLPVLRKDFIQTRDQLKETKDLGADWVLLIAEQLKADKLEELVYYAGREGLKPIVEVQSSYGIASFTKSLASTVMFNNRNLRTSAFDFDLTVAMLKSIPDSFEIIVASGFDVNPGFMDVVKKTGIVDYALIGSLFMKSTNLEETFKSLWENSSTPLVVV